jgi:DNA-binding transcriptional MerR regulator
VTARPAVPENKTMPSDLRRPISTFTIGQLCREFACTPRALRFYEQKGLLAPTRQGLARIYSYRDRARLQLIMRGKAVGMSLVDIREILELYDKGDGGVAQGAKALRKFRDRIAALERQRRDVDQALETLRAASARLEQLLAVGRPDPVTGEARTQP